MSSVITPNLWFNHNAQEAVEYYISVFPNSKIISTEYYPNSSDDGLADFQQDLAGKVLTIEFELNGSPFVAINAGSEFKFSEAVSFSVPCKDQKEIDYYWGKLSAIPESEQCGWCKDKFGLSWQILPDDMANLMKRPNAFAKIMQMHKIIIADF